MIEYEGSMYIVGNINVYSIEKGSMKSTVYDDLGY